MINLLYSKDNISKLCAEGSIANLINMLHLSTEDLDYFWHLVKCDPIVLQTSLGKPVSKRVLQGSLVHGLLSLDSIRKCLWIPREKFNFCTTGQLNLQKVTSLKKMLFILEQVKFPFLIAVSSEQACYDHVVVVWNRMVIDYEAMFTYPLTEDFLRQVCGENATFQKITCGYGTFPSKHIHDKVDKVKVVEWGITEYHNGNNIWSYFVCLKR
jgi:hypothetical protein